MNETTDMPRTGIDSAPRPALRPLSGLIGRGSELGRLLGHIDARRSVRLEAARGAGVTALLRALCAEPPRPAVPDGPIALPVGLPVADLPVVAQRLCAEATTPIGQRQMLVLLDDRGLTADDVDALHDTFTRSLLVVTGGPSADQADLAPVAVQGLSQHHAVGLIEAAMGRPLSIEEGRTARFVATAVDGMPGPLVQAAAAVRDAGLTFDDVLDLLDDPPRPTALAVSLQHALGDELHVTLSHIRALGDTPATTRIVAAACGIDVAEATRRLRRLAMLGMVTSDGRDGWSASSTVPAVSEPVRASASSRVAEWLADTDATLDVFDTASLVSVVADRFAAEDHPTTLALARSAQARLPLDGLEQTQQLLENAVAWALPEPELVTRPAVARGGATLAAGTTGTDLGADGAADDDVDGTEPAGAATDAPPAASASERADADVEGSTPPTQVGPAEHPAQTPGAPVDTSGDSERDSRQGMPNAILGLLGDRRRLALIAVGAAAVIAAVLLVVPSLRDDPTPPVIRGDVDLGVASLGETRSGTLTLDLSTTTARTPVALVLNGPDADAFTVDPVRCDGLDCRASVTFTPDRSGIHLASVNAVDADDSQVAVAELAGSGTGDPPEATTSTNLAVTLFPSEPTPITAGDSAVVPVGVRNNGPDDSTGSRLVVTVPDGVTADAAGCSFEAPTLTCPVAELAAASSERIDVTLSVPRRAVAVRIDAEVTPLADEDALGGDNAAGFTYRVVTPNDQQN